MLTNSGHSFTRVRRTLILIYLLLFACVTASITTDLYSEYESERKQWNEYRAYGFVRAFGVDLSDQLKNYDLQDTSIPYQQIFRNLLESHPEATDLAMLDVSGQTIALVGPNQQILKEHIAQKQVLLPSTDVGYDDNVNLQTIVLSATNAASPTRAQFGVMMLKADARPRFYLLIAFQPPAQESMHTIILFFCAGIFVVYGIFIWQVLSYTWSRIYLEPVAQLNSAAKSLQAGKWPANTDCPDAHDQAPLIKIAQDCLKRCYAQHVFLQAQLQELRQGLPHKATQCTEIASRIERNCSFIPGITLVAFCRPSVATFQWHIFIYTSFLVAMWVGIPLWSAVVQFSILIVLLCIPISILPRFILGAYSKTTLAASMVGVILGGFFYYLFDHLILAQEQANLRMACAMVTTLGIAWLVRFCFAFRKQSI